jgi:membrane protein DedA with SNARE-associated domain
VISHFTDLVAQYGYAAIFVVIALENVGLLLPGETILITAAIYAGETHGLNIISSRASSPSVARSRACSQASTRMERTRFLVFNGPGAVAWASTFGFGAYARGRRIEALSTAGACWSCCWWRLAQRLGYGFCVETVHASSARRIARPTR